jgi:replicative DNA helicase Mcm
MTTALSTQSLQAAWETFLTDYYKDLIETTALNYPETKSIIIDYQNIDLRDPALAEHLLEHPALSLRAAEDALKLIEVPVEPRPPLHVRVQNIPKINHIPIRELRAERLGKFVAVEGIIKKVVEVRPKLEDASFMCRRCGAVFRVAQEENVLTEPEVCPEEQGGCGQSSSFKLLTEDSRFIDSQKVEIQENPEGLRGGEQPERLTVFLEDDMVGHIAPGDRVVLNGIFRAQQRRQGSLKLAEFLKVLDTNSIEIQQLDFEEVEILPEDEERIEEIAASESIYTDLRKSFAPEIFGLEEIKDALLMTLFGGVAKEYKDGTRLRGDIHVLLVGDPGVAKSQLLRYLSKLAPRSVYTSGKGASSAGLTASAVRDEFSEGQWSLEAGALVLADKGVALIDELDKMTEHDSSAMHQAMEQQEISISKAGINATLKSRCAVVAAANPKLGRFDEFAPIVQQIDLPLPLFTRFDLIFPIKDKPERGLDDRLATHILSTHRAGQVHEFRKMYPDQSFTEAQEKELFVRLTPFVDERTLRKYVAYARRYVFPVLDEDAAETIRNFYVEIRNQNTESIPFTPRALEALVRLSEASARIRLSNVATLDDAKRAISTFMLYIRGVGYDAETGRLDFDILATGASHSQQDRMRKVLEIIRGLASESEYRAANVEDILRAAGAQNIPEEKARQALETLKQRGQIYSPSNDRYAAV